MRGYIAISKDGLTVTHSEHENGVVKDYFLADEISDGYHTMHELYQHRMALNIALFNYLYDMDRMVRGDDAVTNPYIVKSKFHYDGTMFEGGYFVVVMNSPTGQISYHYTLKHWDKFKILEVDKVPWPYDGHSSKDSLERLLSL